MTPDGERRNDMETKDHRDIRIGTQVPHRLVQAFAPHGFESFDLVFQPPDASKLSRIAEGVLERISGTGAVVSALNTFANPFTGDESGEAARRLWRELIGRAGEFGCSIVAGFTGRLPGLPVKENIPRFVEVFSPLVELAEERNVRIAFETCPKEGKPNIAVNPEAWRAIFEAVPSPRLGLQWEPAHQLRQLMDPIAQLREWVVRVFHVHGKDGTIDSDLLRREGVLSSAPYFVDRTVSFGQTDWQEIITILRSNGFTGSIDIEGFHDPVYRDELELTGQLHALRYLAECRGGEFVELRV